MVDLFQECSELRPSKKIRQRPRRVELRSKEDIRGETLKEEGRAPRGRCEGENEGSYPVQDSVVDGTSEGPRSRRVV